MNNKALLVASYGTAYKQMRKKTIDAIEWDLRRAFPDRAFYRAWTGERIRAKLLQETGAQIDSVLDALDRMLRDGITDVLIQPTHMLSGGEYISIKKAVCACAGRFDRISLGSALLTDTQSLSDLAQAIAASYPNLSGEEMLVLVGHGSVRTGDGPYAALDALFKERGYTNICVGTVEHEPGIASVLAEVKEKCPRRVYLAPLLVTAGGHAIRDIAGEDSDSWRAQIERVGPEPICILKGLGEYAAVRGIYVEHARRAQRIHSKDDGDDW